MLVEVENDVRAIETRGHDFAAIRRKESRKYGPFVLVEQMNRAGFQVHDAKHRILPEQKMSIVASKTSRSKGGGLCRGYAFEDLSVFRFP